MKKEKKIIISLIIIIAAVLLVVIFTSFVRIGKGYIAVRIPQKLALNILEKYPEALLPDLKQRRGIYSPKEISDEDFVPTPGEDTEPTPDEDIEPIECESDSDCIGSCGEGAHPASYDCCINNGCGCCVPDNFYSCPENMLPPIGPGCSWPGDENTPLTCEQFSQKCLNCMEACFALFDPDSGDPGPIGDSGPIHDYCEEENQECLCDSNIPDTPGLCDIPPLPGICSNYGAQACDSFSDCNGLPFETVYSDCCCYTNDPGFPWPPIIIVPYIIPCGFSWDGIDGPVIWGGFNPDDVGDPYCSGGILFWFDF